MGPLLAGKPAQEPGDLARTLAGELRALTFEYALGSRLHRAYVTDPEALSAMAKALRIVSQDSGGPEPLGCQLLGRTPVMVLEQGQGQRQSFRIAGRNQLHNKRWGRVTLAPAFFQEVEAWVSEVEQTRVRLTVENPFPEQRLQRLLAFQELDDRPWQEARIQGPHLKVEIHGPLGLRSLQSGYHGLYVPASQATGESWGFSVELQSWVGDSIGFTLVDTTRCVTRPLHAALLRHETLGSVWVDDAFRDALLELHTPSFPVQENQNAGSKVSFLDVRAAAKALLQGPPQILLYRGVLPGESGLQHIWPLRLGEVRTVLEECLPLSNLRLQETPMAKMRERWAPRSAELGSLSWLDAAGVRWTLYQENSTHAWLPPIGEWKGTQALWSQLSQHVR